MLEQLFYDYGFTKEEYEEIKNSYSKMIYYFIGVGHFVRGQWGCETERVGAEHRKDGPELHYRGQFRSRHVRARVRRRFDAGGYHRAA